MIKILRNLKDHKWSVLLIFLLLIGEAYCDLALPSYMSRIVDVGISQNGIDDLALSKARASTMEKLFLFMPDAEVATVKALYTIDAEGNYNLSAISPADRDALSDQLQMPIMAVAQAAERGVDLDATLLAVQSGQVQKGEFLAQASQQMQQAQGAAETSDNTALMAKQVAVQFARAEYEAVGLDLGAMQTNYILIEGAKMLAFTFGMIGCAILVGLIASRIGAKLGLTLRGKVFKRVVSFSSAELEKFSTASLITRSTNDIQQVQMVCTMMLRMVLYAPVLGIGGVLKVLGTNTGMSWIIAVGVAVLLLVVGVLISIAMPKFKIMQTLLDRVNLVAREILSGLSVIRAFNREKHENERFEKVNMDLKRTQLFTNRVMSTMFPLMNLLMMGITVMIVWFGGKGIDAGTMQVGSMMAFMTYAMVIVSSFLMLSMVSVMLPRALVAMGRIEEVIETKPTISDKDSVKDSQISDCKGVVTFDRVSFRYPDAKQNVLTDISFTARPGQTTAIIGSTGCGKSTLLNLIPRFYDVTEGRVTLDGIDIRDLSQQCLRGKLGYVPQKGVLFTGTIESNLKFGGDEIADDSMQEAARIAQADTFIEEKADKYQDAIAQGGTNVSGGQKQRLSIARALAKNPRVLLFDDSFSALDYKTELSLRRALAEGTRDTTILIVAQRVSTVLHADQILVLDEGRLAGLGTHVQLMESCALYQEIAKSQLSEAELKGGIGA